MTSIADMTEQELEGRIAELDLRISYLTKERAAFKQRLAESRTDLKVGDRVTYMGQTTVWELKKIAPDSWGNEPRFFGSRIKKDGTPGQSVNQIYVPYKQKLVKVEA